MLSVGTRSCVKTDLYHTSQTASLAEISPRFRRTDIEFRREWSRCRVKSHAVRFLSCPFSVISSSELLLGVLYEFYGEFPRDTKNRNLILKPHLEQRFFALIIINHPH
jgi:hypothetical protein